jgi:ribose 5-phosphate isomerase B
MRAGIATYHGGFGLKQEFVTHFCAPGQEVVDFGAHKLDPADDSPDCVRSRMIT